MSVLHVADQVSLSGQIDISTDDPDSAAALSPAVYEYAYSHPVKDRQALSKTVGSRMESTGSADSRIVYAYARTKSSSPNQAHTNYACTSEHRYS